MKTALIPPIHDLETWGEGELHLVLSHLLKYPDYFDHYRKQSSKGAYVILDNSAHEMKRGQILPFLLTQAVALGASEIVIPDELFSSKGTLDGLGQSMNYLSTLEGQSHYLSVGSPRLMFVPQGSNPSEFESCFFGMLELITAYQYLTTSLGIGFTLGISKDYEIFDGGLSRILNKLALPYQESMRYQIHMLGWGRKLTDLKSISREFEGYIRSIDSAKPFVYALAGVELSEEYSTPPYPGRQKDYFENCSVYGLGDLVSKNVGYFRQLADGSKP